ncbi:MAG: DUF1287 domain-containing protein [Planctomycetota bacterium]|nr:DUF1287 domain-containing protein [Planctomycetota bacterium]
MTKTRETNPLLVKGVSSPAFSGRRNVALFVGALGLVATLSHAGCDKTPPPQPAPASQPSSPAALPPSSFGDRLAAAALSQVGVTLTYDSRYVRLAYPGGDVPVQTGVCCDVIVRAYRALGADLQQLLHEDMVRAFAQDPRMYRLAAPDANIDHRRVANLAKFMERQGASLPPTTVAGDYRPGDVVAWRLSDGRLHIGLVVAGASGPPVVHNIGAGARREDRLFAWTIVGHYRYHPARATAAPTWVASAGGQ